MSNQQFEQRYQTLNANNSQSNRSLKGTHNNYNQINGESQRGRIKHVQSEIQAQYGTSGTFKNLNLNHSTQRLRSQKRVANGSSQHSNATRDDRLSRNSSNIKKLQQTHPSSRNQSKSKYFQEKFRGYVQNSKFICKKGLNGNCPYGWNCRNNHYYSLLMGKWENNPDSTDDVNLSKERSWVNKGIFKQQKKPNKKVLVRIVETKLVSVEEATELIKGRYKDSCYRYEIQVAATNKKAIENFQKQIAQATNRLGNVSKQTMDEYIADTWRNQCLELSAPNDELEDSLSENQDELNINTFNTNLNKRKPSQQRNYQVGQMKNQQLKYIPKQEADAQRNGFDLKSSQLRNSNPQNNQLSQKKHNNECKDQQLQNDFSFQMEGQKEKFYEQEQPQQIQEKVSIPIYQRPPFARTFQQEKEQEEEKQPEQMLQESGITPLKKQYKRPQQSGDDNNPILRGNRRPPSKNTLSPFKEDICYR